MSTRDRRENARYKAATQAEEPNPSVITRSGRNIASSYAVRNGKYRPLVKVRTSATAPPCVNAFSRAAWSGPVSFVSIAARNGMDDPPSDNGGPGESRHDATASERDAARWRRSFTKC